MQITIREPQTQDNKDNLIYAAFMPKEIDPKTQDILQQFSEYLTVVEGLSYNTVISYQKDIELFAKNSAVQDITSVAKEDIQHYLRNLKSKSKGNAKPQAVSARTQSRTLSTLKKFYGFLKENAWCVQNPTEGLQSPKLPQSLPKAISLKEIEKLLHYAQGEEPQQKRFLLIVQLLYGGGLRISELLSLKLSDIAAEEDTLLRVTGKGHKTRVVPIGDAASQTLEDYIHTARPLLGTLGNDVARFDWLFPSPYKPKQPLTRIRLYQIIKEAGDAVGINHLSPHVLRHTFATHLVEGQADLRAVQLLLGHSNLATTQIYTKVVTERLKSAIEQHHPLTKMAN